MDSDRNRREEMRIIAGVTGATGVIMSYYLLKALKSIEGCEVYLILSDGAKLTWELESSIPLEEMVELADHVYDERDLAAPVSSGSFVTDGMIVLPCSMKTLAGIASGYAENLIVRAADVCMKEGRKVVLVPREMPFGKIHIRNMKEASELGCVIVPPVLTFYNSPGTIEDMINHIVGKILLQFGISYDKFIPWTGEPEKKC
ncbi:polyprenyl P-hydroxybenzoate and phenylacrylic acid decarboxylase [[Clostridium] hylemonae DSM 15053]|uniref:Flavin prenyltransferase UbiX n=2 Tax=[Clostridium] hylemonae TaxID=89153 RepID=C0C544_9FIRM|nr:polyprenyl P-hydroxybenzoate and phenylacrylic acid decarboxylase [[Clostridium] hylemonae DSM 15053]